MEDNFFSEVMTPFIADLDLASKPSPESEMDSNESEMDSNESKMDSNLVSKLKILGTLFLLFIF